MKIHEYQAKAILARYGVTTPRGEVAFTKEEALQAAQRLKSNICVVKAQIHAGGRGKGGGVKLARSAEEAAEIAGHILGMTLVTPQTGPAGRIVKRLLIEEGLDIKRELYLGLLVDRAAGRVVFMASAGRHGNRRSRQERSLRDLARDHPSCGGLRTLSGPQDRFWTRLTPRSRQLCYALPASPLSRLHRHGRRAA